MNYKSRTLIVSIILLSPFFLISWYMLDNMWFSELLPGVVGFARFLLLFLLSVISSVVLSLGIMFFCKPVRNQNEIMCELEANGYSDRFLELTGAEIERLFSGGEVYSYYRYLAQYVRFRTDAFLYRDDLPNAINCINLINLKDMQEHLNERLESNAFLGYFDVQMSLSCELKDPARATAVMQDAAVYIEKYRGKSALADMYIYEICSLHALTFGDYAKALENADLCCKRDNKPVFTMVGNAMAARVFLKAGQYQPAAERIALVEGVSTTKLQKQIVDDLRKRLNRLSAEGLTGGQNQ